MHWLCNKFCFNVGFCLDVLQVHILSCRDSKALFKPNIENIRLCSAVISFATFSEIFKMKPVTCLHVVRGGSGNFFETETIDG